MATLITVEGLLIDDYPSQTLIQWQEAVGGMVQPVYHNDYVLLVNEEGVLLNLPPNEVATAFVMGRHALFGNALMFTRSEWDELG